MRLRLPGLGDEDSGRGGGEKQVGGSGGNGGGGSGDHAADAPAVAADADADADADAGGPEGGRDQGDRLQQLLRLQDQPPLRLRGRRGVGGVGGGGRGGQVHLLPAGRDGGDDSQAGHRRHPQGQEPAGAGRERVTVRPPLSEEEKSAEGARRGQLHQALESRGEPGVRQRGGDGGGRGRGRGRGRGGDGHNDKGDQLCRDDLNALPITEMYDSGGRGGAEVMSSGFKMCVFAITSTCVMYTDFIGQVQITSKKSVCTLHDGVHLNFSSLCYILVDVKKKRYFKLLNKPL